MARFSIPVSDVAPTVASPLPEFLTYVEGRSHLPTLNQHFGWDSDGVWFGPTAIDGPEEENSYPIFTSFTIPQNTASATSFNVEFDDECSDAGVAIYVDGTTPMWQWNPNPTRISAQFNCPQPEISGIEGSATTEGSLPGPGIYRMVLIYDPLAESNNVQFEVYSTGEGSALLFNLSLNETLPEGSYRIGFAADMDPGDGGRTYIQNLEILVGEEDQYSDSLTNGNSGNQILNTGDITFDGVKIIGAGTASGDGNGYGTMELVPDLNRYSSDQYLVIDPTAPNHIHIRAGGSQDDSGAELILGGEDTHIRVTDYNSTVNIKTYQTIEGEGGPYTQENYWSFGSDGVFYGPGMGTVVVNGLFGAGQDYPILIGSNDRVLLSGTNGEFLNDADIATNQIATLGDIGVETSYAVMGGTEGGTQPTFAGDPLFTAAYIRMSNNLVHFEIQVDMDNITSFGTGQYYMTLPFNAKYPYHFREGCLHDIGGEDQFQISGHVAAGSNTLYLFFAQQAAQDEPFTSTAPITLQTNDNFHIAGTYIAQDIV